MIKIYHNPRCRKSRETLELLNGKGLTVEIVEYLKAPPNKDELKTILSQLGISADSLIRKNEAIFKENYKGRELSDDQWIDVMIEHPKLMERPIVVKDGKARLGRPPEKVLEIL